jgi:hypothetical protein
MPNLKYCFMNPNGADVVCMTKDEAYELVKETGGRGRVRTVVNCCGEDLVCSAFTNTCDQCEADYGMNGDRLAPRSQWGSETGERWQDCY